MMSCFSDCHQVIVPRPGEPPELELYPISVRLLRHHLPPPPRPAHGAATFTDMMGNIGGMMMRKYISTTFAQYSTYEVGQFWWPVFSCGGCPLKCCGTLSAFRKALKCTFSKHITADLLNIQWHLEFFLDISFYLMFTHVLIVFIYICRCMCFACK